MHNNKCFCVFLCVFFVCFFYAFMCFYVSLCVCVYVFVCFVECFCVPLCVFVCFYVFLYFFMFLCVFVCCCVFLSVTHSPYVIPAPRALRNTTKYGIPAPQESFLDPPSQISKSHLRFLKHFLCQIRMAPGSFCSVCDKEPFWVSFWGCKNA